MTILLVVSGFAPVTASAATQFSSCEELVKVWPSAPAKDEKSRTKYIKWKLDNYYTVLIAIVVRPAIYKQNVRLDNDKDGILCEESYENSAKLWLGMSIAFCTLGNGDWDIARSICVKT
jgi:Excalibur calcium-binding domain